MLQDLDGRYRVVNEAVAEYAGMEKGELLGCDESAFMNADAAADIDGMKRSVLEKQRPVTYEVSVELPTMGDRTFSTTRYPHYDQDGDIDGTVAICRDVTDQRDREQQLQVLDRVLRHNLHNEMNVVMGHAEQILAAPDADHTASARHILQSGRDLVEMANKERRIVSLLSEDPTLETVGLRPVLSELVAGINESHPESRISLECPPDVRATADRSITSAFRELIENAIVHNDGPHPHVHVEATTENGVTQVVVSDDGPGIPPDEQLVLTGDEEIQPLFHGSGLGLWLVNHVVKRSNGTLRFVVDDSSGTTVELLLPAQ
jgi:PAS domain S-box-containing protein